jgi:hypothetical protein
VICLAVICWGSAAWKAFSAGYCYLRDNGYLREGV